MLEKYKRLLDRYDAALEFSDWGRRIAQLMPDMDKVYGKMSEMEKALALQYATELYERRICVR